MSFREVKSWSIHCDFPGCGHQFEFGDYTIFADPEDWVQDNLDYQAVDSTKHYCSDHPYEWESDHENGEPYPAPPYLLILDSGYEDDGKVFLVEATS